MGVPLLRWPSSKSLLFLVTGFLVWTLSACSKNSTQFPTAENGVLDLSTWDFRKSGSVPLKGQWYFQWSELLSVGPFQQVQDAKLATIDVPSLWSTQKHPKLVDENLPGRGHATYVLQVLLPPGTRSQDLTISTHAVGTAANWNISTVDGSEILGQMNQGIASSTPNGTLPVRVNASTSLGPSNASSIVIWLSLSNYHVARGGIWNAPQLGLNQTVQQDLYKQTLLNASIFGILMVVALYHIVLFLQWREDQRSLRFALVCLSVGLLHWMSSRFFQQMGLGWSQDGFHWISFLENVAMPLCVMSMYAFIQSLLPSERFKKFSLIFGYLAGGYLLLMTLFTHPVTYSGKLVLYHLHIGGFVSVLGLILVKSWQYAGPLVSELWSDDSEPNDIMMARQIIDTVYIGAFTFIALLFFKVESPAQVSSAGAEHWERIYEEVTERTEDSKYRPKRPNMQRARHLKQAESARLESLSLKKKPNATPNNSRKWTA